MHSQLRFAFNIGVMRPALFEYDVAHSVVCECASGGASTVVLASCAPVCAFGPGYARHCGGLRDSRIHFRRVIEYPVIRDGQAAEC